MRHFILAIMAAVLFMAGPARSDPDVGVFTNTRTSVDATVSTTLVKMRGGTLIYNFTTAVDSVQFQVLSPLADLCFDTDTATGVVGAARIQIYRAVDPTDVVTNNAILLPAVPFTGLNCLELTSGIYWIDVTVARVAAETPKVTLTARRN